MPSLTIKNPSGDYPIHIGEDALASLDAAGLDVFLLVDSHVPEVFIDAVSTRIHPVVTLAMPGGETIKTLATYQDVIDKMLVNGLSKASLMVAVGGGTLLDLAGFVAATYQRGIPFIAVPTTLLAMVDASIGGKTALNINGHKNMIGAFHTPRSVHIVPSALNSLPLRERRSGYAEIIKMALLKDRALFNALKNPLDMSDIIRRSIDIKRRVVERDYRDVHERHVLNYGHTIGHALEALHPSVYTHGECVAFGMRQMARGKPFEKQLSALLAHHGLLVDIPYDKDTLYRLIRSDKKRRQTTLTLAIVDEIGTSRVETVPFDTIMTFL